MTERYGAHALVANPAAPADVLLRLLALNDRSITYRLSCHAALPDEVAEAMLTHPERWVRQLLADSFTAPPELRARLLDGPASDAMAVAIGPNPYGIQAPPLPDEAYERLLNHEQVNVRYETVNAASTPAHVLVPLAGHADPYFRRAACRHVWHLLDAAARWTGCPACGGCGTRGTIRRPCGGVRPPRTPGCGPAPQPAPSCRRNASNSSPGTPTSPYGCCSPKAIPRLRRNCCSTCICTACTGLCSR